ncbi:MAG: hypothetical protein KDA80_20000 [Planctomycetaceae bacterium]|nr:hypothetical protein [Planctomycetaceae bacterium]
MSEDWDDDWEEDVDWPDDLDDEETYTVKCVHCGALVHEDAVACPSCGDYEFKDTRSGVLHQKPIWYLILAVLGILAVIFALLMPW